MDADKESLRILPLKLGSAELPTDEEDAIVCFCYRLTTGMLKEAYKKCGSLQKVEELTKAGTGCTGCQVVLQSLFGETPTNHYVSGVDTIVGTSCVKPGSRTMKGLIVANNDLESTVYASNGISPQLGKCDTTTQVEYALIDHRGRPVHRGTEEVATNATFKFETHTLDIERPFYGMFLLTLGRANFGAARFNVYWRSRSGGVCSTHENATSGRPRLWIPLLIGQLVVEGPTTIYFALMNPASHSREFTITVYEVDRGDSLTWSSRLDSHCTTWINANEHLFKPAIQKFGDGRWTVKVVTNDLDVYAAISAYFFTHNKVLNLWSCNHL
jgi:hypothetical protein